MYITLPALSTLDGATVMARIFNDKKEAEKFQERMAALGTTLNIHGIHDLNEMGAPKNYAGV